jgi:ribonuclease T2
MKALPPAFLVTFIGLLLSMEAHAQQHFTFSQQPGIFDYYQLSLSWSPEFCYSKSDNPECSGHYGFIVHGLWPQFRNGRWPEYCGRQPGLSNPNRMLDIMPDPHLIQHEWSAHGTCSGLNADNYFGLIRRTFTSLKIPRQFIHPTRQLTISPESLKQIFVQANPSLHEASMAVTCKGAYLVAVEICLTKEGKPTACAGLRDCKASMLHVPRVR